MLHFYEDWTVRSPSTEMHVPAVLLLREQVPYKWRLRFTAPLVFLRDDFTCQYCCERFPVSELTIDHVLPRHYGGKTLWSNVVAACAPCNVRRGHNTSIRPKREPWKPTYHEMLKLRRRLPLQIPHSSWAYYVSWPSDNLHHRPKKIPVGKMEF